jgi:hypothetical protein
MEKTWEGITGVRLVFTWLLPLASSLALSASLALSSRSLHCISPLSLALLHSLLPLALLRLGSLLLSDI